MNVVDIVILAVLGVSLVWGLYRGFLHTLLNTGACLLAAFGASVFGPRLASYLGGNAGIAETLLTYTDAAVRVGDYDLASQQVSGLSQSVIDTILQNVSLPEPIANLLSANLSTQAFASSGLTTVNEYVSSTVVSVAVQVLCFLLCFFAIYLILSVVINLIQNVLRFPLLKHFDLLAGGVFGAARGALICYLLFLLVPIALTVVPIEGLEKLISESRLAGIFGSDGFFASVVAGGVNILRGGNS